MNNAYWSKRSGTSSAGSPVVSVTDGAASGSAGAPGSRATRLSGVLLAAGVVAASDVAVAVISSAGTVAVASPAVGDAVRVAVSSVGVGLSVGAGVVGRGTCVVAGGGVVGDTNGVVAAAVGDPAGVTCKVTVLVSAPPAYSARRV